MTEPQTVHQTSASVMIPTGSMIVILKTANPCFQRLAAYSMASLRGFEPPAPALGERCSIQLSYRDISYIITDFHRHCKLIFTIISACLNEKLNSTVMLNLVLHSVSISFIIFSTRLSAVEKRYLCVNQFPKPKSI